MSWRLSCCNHLGGWWLMDVEWLMSSGLVLTWYQYHVIECGLHLGCASIFCHVSGLQSGSGCCQWQHMWCCKIGCWNSPCGWETQTTAVKRVLWDWVLNQNMWRVLHNRCKHCQNLSHHGYGYGIHTGAKIQHCTCTCMTHGPKTAGKPVPMQNPTCI